MADNGGSVITAYQIRIR